MMGRLEREQDLGRLYGRLDPYRVNEAVDLAGEGVILEVVGLVVAVGGGILERFSNKGSRIARLAQFAGGVAVGVGIVEGYRAEEKLDKLEKDFRSGM